MKKSTIILIVVIAVIAVGLIAVYFAKKGGYKPSFGMNASNLSSLDDEYYLKMKNRLMKVPSLKNQMSWILDDVAYILKNNGQGKYWALEESDLAGGRVTKTGALFAEYGRSVSGWVKDDAALLDDMWALNNEFHQKATGL